MKYITGFARFWYDFVVGDSWLLAVAGAAVLVLGYALVEANLDVLAELLIPIVAIAGVAVSLPRRV